MVDDNKDKYIEQYRKVLDNYNVWNESLVVKLFIYLCLIIGEIPVSICKKVQHKHGENLILPGKYEAFNKDNESFSECDYS